jgi:spore maturation protein CgeB
LRIAFFGSSLVSAYWNGAATYYRGIIRALHRLGHEITFYEPDAHDRQKHRDIADPEWARVVVYSASSDSNALQAVEQARQADMLVKASGVGVFDELLEAVIPKAKRPDALAVYWDVDAPATIDRLSWNPADPLLKAIPGYDLVLTYGGGDAMIEAYMALGAKKCAVVYNALDPDIHHPVAPDPAFEADLGFLGNRLPDREARLDEFFFRVAKRLPAKRFLLGGNGWQDRPMSDNVRYVGHVYTRDHNAFNCTPRALLNVSRDSMARHGFSPATRVFEALGAGACLITDFWEGIEFFLEPGKEVLVAGDGSEIAQLLQNLKSEEANRIGKAGRKRVLAEHTYVHRALQLESLIGLARPGVKEMTP